MRRSGLRHIDLYLLHSPYGEKRIKLECWKAVEDAIAEGEVQAGEVSNFGVKHVRSPLLKWFGSSADELLCSYENFWIPNLESYQPSIKSKCTHSILKQTSRHSARNTG